jgi:hypothetical protein
MSTFRSVENPSPNGPHDIAWTLYNPGGAKLTRVFNNGHPVFEHWHPFEKPAPEYVPPAWTWGGLPADPDQRIRLLPPWRPARNFHPIEGASARRSTARRSKTARIG